jgi:hypothetical protein
VTTGGARAEILLGTHTYAAEEQAGHRQEAALASLRELTRAEIVNVQLAHAPHEASGIRTLAVLKQTSISVSGRAGREKPLVREILDALAFEATARGLPWFGYVNGDILVSQAAVDWIVDGGKQACVLSREDFDRVTGGSRGILIHGIDAVAMTTAWWRLNRTRFRGYILGEPTWDNVYASIVLCHADAAIENARGLLRHEEHDSRWSQSPFAEYTQLLAAHDAPYFSLWCQYLDRLERMRATPAANAS